MTFFDNFLPRAWFSNVSSESFVESQKIPFEYLFLVLCYWREFLEYIQKILLFDHRTSRRLRPLQVFFLFEISIRLRGQWVLNLSMAMLVLRYNESRIEIGLLIVSEVVSSLAAELENVFYNSRNLEIRCFMYKRLRFSYFKDTSSPYSMAEENQIRHYIENFGKDL